jgi:hypothetical protein
MRFGVYLVEQGVVSAAQFAEAVSRQMQDRVPLGQMAMDLGYLTKEQLAELLLKQDETLKPISKILVAMGALTPDEMESELKNYRRYMADRMDPSGVLRTVV